MLQKVVNKLFKSNLLFLLILFLGLFLRLNNLDTWPREGATFDEYAWTWQGMNLVEKGIPISWSPHPQYKNANVIVYHKAHFRIVQPYLEHPPLFGLVAGSFAIIRGVHGMFDLKISDIRPLAVILGMLSIFMLFVLVSALYGRTTALISSLLYATIPTIVIGSRLVENENFFIPIWLLSLYLIVKFINDKKSLYRNLAAVLCGLLILAKVPWIAGAGSVILIFLYRKQYKDLFKFTAIVTVFFLAYFAYGFYYDPKLFLSLWGLQLNRYDILFTSIYALFQKPYLVDRFTTDGWIYFGWFAYVLLLVKDIKKNYIIIFALLAYFAVFLIAIPDESGHGWYRYPFYPFLVVSVALFIKDYFAKNWPLTFMFLAFVGTTLLGLTWQIMFGFSYFIFRLAAVSWGAVLIPQFFPFKISPKFGKVISYTWLTLFIFMNIWAVLLYNEQ